MLLLLKKDNDSIFVFCFHRIDNYQLTLSEEEWKNCPLKNTFLYKKKLVL